MHTRRSPKYFGPGARSDTSTNRQLCVCGARGGAYELFFVERSTTASIATENSS